RIIIRADAGDRGASEALVVQLLADRLIMIGVALKEGNLDAVEARLLDLRDGRKQLGGDVGGPEEQVHSVTHVIVLGQLSLVVCNRVTGSMSKSNSPAINQTQIARIIADSSLRASA